MPTTRSGRIVSTPTVSFSTSVRTIPVPIPAPSKMFLLNPYDADLDITNKEDRRLYLDACKGITGYEFGGERDKIGQFLKLLEVEMSDKRLTQALNVAISWKPTSRNPEKKANLLEDDSILTDQVTKHVDLIWSESGYDAPDTPEFFIDIATPPTTTAELEDIRNKFRLKHVILGKKIWETLTSNYKADLSADSSLFTRKENTDGILLLNYIIKDVKPSTTVGLNNIKDELETKKLTDFPSEDVKAYNKWFSGKRDEIRKAEGGSEYNEYIRNLFKGYLSGTNEEFKSAINDEKRKWVTDRLDRDYAWTDLKRFALVTYNNLVASNEYVMEDASGSHWRGSAIKKTEPTEQVKFLAMLTQVLDSKGISDKKSTGRNTSTPPDDMPPKGWKLINSTGAKTCQQKNAKGTVRQWYWSENDCHEQPTWCPRKDCRSRAEYKKFMEEKRNKASGAQPQAATSSAQEGLKKNEDFKIALCSMVSEEDMKTLEDQFF